MRAEARVVPVVLFFLLTLRWGCVEMRAKEEVWLPLYIRKARELLLRQKAFQDTQDRRMEVISKALSSFANDLYRHHVNSHPSNGSYGNVLISPVGAYTSLAMMLTASRGVTKREVASALALDDITGVHHTLQRAFESYRADDSHDINNDVSDGDMGDGKELEFGLSEKELEDFMKNDYIVDNSVSYNTGQTNLMFSDGTIVSDSHHNHGDETTTAEERRDSIAIRFANGMFHSEDVGLSQKFIMRFASLYGAPPMAMQKSNPEDSINLWVDATTYSAISREVKTGSIDKNTLLVLVGATYFRAAWEEEFDKELVPIDFRTFYGDVVMADCMYHAGNYSVKTLDQLAARVLEIPYVRGRYSLFIFLPNTKKVQRGLPDFETQLKDADLQILLKDMPKPSNTLVMIPKFSIHSRFSLKPMLQTMGAQRMFNKGKADLGRMTDELRNRLYVSDVFHRVTFHVDDGKPRDDLGGKVSVDATQYEAGLGADFENSTSEIPSPHDNDKADDYHYMYKEDDDYFDDNDDDYDDYSESDEKMGEESDFQGHFIVDRPFFFVVKDNEFDLILLMGRVTDPLP